MPSQKELDEKLKYFYEHFLYCEISSGDYKYILDEMQNRDFVNTIKIQRIYYTISDDEPRLCDYEIITESGRCPSVVELFEIQEHTDIFKYAEQLFEDYHSYIVNVRIDDRVGAKHDDYAEYLEISKSVDVRKWYDEYLVPKLKRVINMVKM